ncbi:MAG: single-stranded-DNA-specific exonuclease RecJ [Lachnospiraceae bacterium]|nr:single-stranded-DNA-specific exonuclease RecJ [Lachnospiraceae bacterium]
MSRVNKKWTIRRHGEDYQAIGRELGVNPLLVWMMMNREIPREEMESYLHPKRSDLGNPHTLLDGDKAADILCHAIESHQKIRIMGDYDIDGIMSTYILHSGLRSLGADCDYQIPHRVRDGYGLNPRLVEEAAEEGRQVLVTCDNGISSFDAIRSAKEKGMTVIVTDHHAIAADEHGEDKLPPADALVNPHRKDDPTTYKEICGAVVAWKFLDLVYEKSGKGSASEEWWKFLPFAAIATVGDVMPLREENRAIVKLGLSAMRDLDNIGLSALIEEKQLDKRHMTAFQIGFVLGPCLNAAGRLESALQGVELLECQDRARAAEIAGHLADLNEKRKKETEHGVDEAEFLLKEEGWDKDRVLVIYEPDVPESVVGIVAGRIRERTNKPTIVLTDGQDEVKGSARSIEAYHMYNSLLEVSDLLDKFGGHPMAAGMSLPRGNVDRFRKALNDKCRLTDEDLTQNLRIDADMTFFYLLKHPELVGELDLLEPFGNGNEKPVFAESHTRVLKMRTIGKEGQYLKFTLQGKNQARIEALYFGDGVEMKKDLTEAFGEDQVEAAMWGRANRLCLTVAYYPTINSFRGSESVEVIISDYLIPKDVL